jgi:GntR family transcriptional regulator of vanillate catabolism
MSAPRSRKKPPKSAPRKQGGRLVDHITQELRQLILDRKIAPGTVLIQTEWAEKLQVSRTPLREAFRILEQDGLVQVSNGNRTVQVVSFSEQELRDLYEIRQVIDGLAARLLATKGISPKQDAELVELLDVMESARKPFDPATMLAADIAFFLKIAEFCGNSRVAQQASLIKMTNYSLHSYLTELDPSSESLERILEATSRQHRSIYAAIKSGDGDLAELAASHHINATLNSGLITRAAKPSDVAG